MKEEKRGSGRPEKRKKNGQELLAEMANEAAKRKMTYGQYVAMLERGAKEDRR